MVVLYFTAHILNDDQLWHSVWLLTHFLLLLQLDSLDYLVHFSRWTQRCPSFCLFETEVRTSIDCFETIRVFNVQLWNNSYPFCLLYFPD